MVSTATSNIPRPRRAAANFVFFCSSKRWVWLKFEQAGNVSLLACSPSDAPSMFFGRTTRLFDSSQVSPKKSKAVCMSSRWPLFSLHMNWQPACQEARLATQLLHRPGTSAILGFISSIQVPRLNMTETLVCWTSVSSKQI